MILELARGKQSKYRRITVLCETKLCRNQHPLTRKPPIGELHTLQINAPFFSSLRIWKRLERPRTDQPDCVVQVVLNSVSSVENRRYRIWHLHISSLEFSRFLAFSRLSNVFFFLRIKGRAGALAEFLLKCMSCFLWCLEKFLAFVNRNAYIQCCKSAFCTITIFFPLS